MPPGATDGAFRHDAAAPGAAGASDAEPAGEGATVIEHPLKVAPAHSVVPPADDGESAPAGADGASKRA